MNQLNEAQLRKWVRKVLLESDKGEKLLNEDMSKTFIEPFTDVFKVAKVAFKDILTTAKYNFDVLMTWDPKKLKELKGNFKERKKRLKEEMNEAMASTQAVLDRPDVKLASFLFNPAGYLGASAMLNTYKSRNDIVDFFKEAGFGTPSDKEREATKGKDTEIKDPTGLIGTAFDALKKIFFFEEKEYVGSVIPEGLRRRATVLSEQPEKEGEEQGFDKDAAVASSLDELGVTDKAQKGAQNLYDSEKKSIEELLALYSPNFQVAKAIGEVQSLEELMDVVEEAKARGLDVGGASADELTSGLEQKANDLMSDEKFRDNFIRAALAKEGKDIPEDEPIPDELNNADESKLKEEVMSSIFANSATGLKETSQKLQDEISKSFLEEFDEFKDESFEFYGVDEESAKVISATSAGEKFLSLYEDPEGLLSKIEAGEESVSDSDLS